MTALSEELAAHANAAVAAALTASERGGAAGATAVLARQGRWVATGIYPYAEGDEAPLRALGRLCVALRADQAITMFDILVNLVHESDLPEAPRPRDDPRAQEALLIVVADREGAQDSAVMRYHRGDDGRLTVEPPAPVGLMAGARFVHPRAPHRREQISVRRALAACERAGVLVTVPS